MPIQDLAREDVVTTGPETPVPDVARMMDEETVGSVVVTEGDQPVGIITDRDLALRVVAESANPADHTAADVMSTDLHTATPDTGFYQAAEEMRANGIRRLPLCDDDGSLVGIITSDDLNELLADEHQELSTVLQAQRPSY
ncbi:signal transduction protein with CBS domains [Salinarchaeum sp. Harcht-Bsk1]|uniref:CBS domain-containing protein n=1 Tax=Salinarchaeum sp. Harcht-Bsk1 TaxID=1333523 RepID=UPI000342368D|nr:CBS domain-containing protein [Salinarchaeum sp. Harcht-Bsk1]AGN01473.1 signal transduction protein with CBS domains [Salinarchaeum sp. Harcht-Bsk1]